MLPLTSDRGRLDRHSSLVKAGGIDQWIQIRGEDRDNPVLLVLHGGPGWADAVFTLPLRSWERHFTMVRWDHRGTGKTLGRTGKAGTGEMTFDRRVAGAVELIEILRRHLGVEKVIVLAESMGTLTGLPLALRRPDLVAALVVTDLYVDMAANEARRWQLTLQRLRAAGNTKGLAALEGIGPWRSPPRSQPARPVHLVRGLPVVHRPDARGAQGLRRLHPAGAVPG